VASGSELYKMSGSRLEPFARASTAIGSAVAVANGTIYLGEATRLQAVSESGAVTTVARVQVGGMGLGPKGVLYVVIGNDIEQLVDQRFAVVATAAQFKGLPGVPVGGLGLGSVTADGAGDLYISASGIGFNLYELTKSGRARYISGFRGANGKTAPLSVGPHGVVYGEWQNAIYQADGGGISLYLDFTARTVSDIGGTFLPAFIAAPATTGSPLYAVADGENGWSADSAIVAIYPGHRVTTLWRSASKQQVL